MEQQQISGLIIRQPYANHIITGKKKWENRSRFPPLNYRGIPLVLLSEGLALGIIKIVDVQPNSVVGARWKIKIIKVFDKPLKYKHKGQQIWVKNVQFEKDWFGEWDQIIKGLKIG